VRVGLICRVLVVTCVVVVIAALPAPARARVVRLRAGRGRSSRRQPHGIRNRTPFADQFQPYAYAGAPDFDYHSFRMTNVLRWEYRPGSALYVVWQQARGDTLSSGQFRFRRDFNSVFDIPGTNVFLVKFSYWLNL
jgi:hypothetical protein